jgi:hypothetical protein
MSALSEDIAEALAQFWAGDRLSRQSSVFGLTGIASKEKQG